MVRLTAVAIAAAISVAPVSQPGSSSRVSVHVSVADSTGRFVTDLQAADFEIRDQGKARAIESFLARVPTRSVVVLLDVSTSMTRLLDRALFAAESVLTQLPAQDHVRLGTFSGNVRIEPPITGNGLDAIRSLGQRFTPGGPSALFDAVFAGIDAIAGEPERRVIILVTDGGDTTSRRSLAEVIEHAQAQDDAVLALGLDEATSGLGPRGAASPMVSIMRADFRELRRLTEETGGGIFEGRAGSLNAATGRLIEQLRSEYRLEFTPAELDGKRHRLEVVVKRKGLRAHVRSRFVAGRPDE